MFFYSDIITENIYWLQKSNFGDVKAYVNYPNNLSAKHFPILVNRTTTATWLALILVGKIKLGKLR